MKKIVHSDIVLGKPIEFSIYSEGGILLFRRGSVIHMPDQISRLLLRGAQYDEAEIDTRPRASNEPAPAHEDPPPFEHLNTLLLNLKHMLATIVVTATLAVLATLTLTASAWQATFRAIWY